MSIDTAKYFPSPESQAGAMGSDTAKYFPPVEYSADSYDPFLSVEELNQQSGNAITSPGGRSVAPVFSRDKAKELGYDDRESAIVDRYLAESGGTNTGYYFGVAKAGMEIAARRQQESDVLAKENLANRNEFMRGLYRGADSLQATYQGGLGMLSSLAGDKAGAQERFRAYQEEMRQASENPRTEMDLFSTDAKTGAFGSLSNFGTYAAGTLGEAVPSLAESVLSGIAGAALGAAIIPAPDPGDVVTVPVGAVGGLIGKGAIKKAIASTAAQYAKQGVAADAAEQLAKQYVGREVAKRVGAVAANTAVTGLHEGGGMYAEGLQQGYDSPGTAAALGVASGLSESLLGAAPGVLKAFAGRSGVDEIARQKGVRAAAGYLWDIVKESGQEGVQEGFQEFLGSVNQEINDPNFNLFTKENFMRWAEAAGAGAVVGGAVRGGVVGTQLATVRGRSEGQRDFEPRIPSPPPESDQNELIFKIQAERKLLERLVGEVASDPEKTISRTVAKQFGLIAEGEKTNPSIRMQRALDKIEMLKQEEDRLSGIPSQQSPPPPGSVEEQAVVPPDVSESDRQFAEQMAGGVNVDKFGEIIPPSRVPAPPVADQGEQQAATGSVAPDITSAAPETTNPFEETSVLDPNAQQPPVSQPEGMPSSTNPFDEIAPSATSVQQPTTRQYPVQPTSSEAALNPFEVPLPQPVQKRSVKKPQTPLSQNPFESQPSQVASKPTVASVPTPQAPSQTSAPAVPVAPAQPQGSAPQSSKVKSQVPSPAKLLDRLESIEELNAVLDNWSADDKRPKTSYSTKELLDLAKSRLNDFSESGHSLAEDLTGDNGPEAKKYATKQRSQIKTWIKIAEKEAATASDLGAPLQLKAAESVPSSEPAAPSQDVIIGERLTIAGKPAVRSSSVMDQDNVRYELFKDEDAGGGTIRSTDMDSGNVVFIRTYQDFEKARGEYSKLEDSSKSVAQPPAPVATENTDSVAPSVVQKEQEAVRKDGAEKPVAKKKPVAKADQEVSESPEKTYLSSLSEEDLQDLADAVGVKATKDARIDELLANPQVASYLKKVVSEKKPSKKKRRAAPRDTGERNTGIPKDLQTPQVVEVPSKDFTEDERKQERILKKIGVTLRLTESGNQDLPGMFIGDSRTIWYDRDYLKKWDENWKEEGRPEKAMTWGLFAHEMFHAIKQSSPKAWRSLYNWVRKNDPEGLGKARVAYLADQMRIGNEGYVQKLLSDEDLRNDEGLSRYLEDRAAYFKFWNELGKARPGLLAKIGRWVRRVLRFAEPGVTNPDTLAGQARLAIERAMKRHNVAMTREGVVRAAVGKDRGVENERKARTLDEVRSRVAKDYSLTVSSEPMRMIDGKSFSSLDPDAVGAGLLVRDADSEMQRMMRESLQEAGVPDEIASTVKVPSSADVDYAFRLTDGSRYWYELSAIGFVKDFFNLSRKLTEHLIDIVAGTSGGQKPTDNLRVAVAAMSQDMRGSPVSVGTRDESSLTAALSPATLETHKFGNFSDTMQVLGGLRPGVKPLPTIDLQMAAVFGVKHAAIASDPRMYEAMSRFLIKLRDAQNAMLKNGEQPYESWQIQALLWVAQRDTSDPDSFNIGMPKIVAQLKEAGIPTPGGKITEETLMDPRTSDVLAPTSKIIPEAYTAAIGTQTKLTKVGKESAEVLEKLKAIDAPWARNLVDEFEKIQRRTMRAIGNRRPPKPGNKTRQKSVASMLLSVIMDKSTGSHELSRVDTDAWGTFEGEASPNIRFPLNLGAVGDTEEGGGTKRYVPTSDHRKQFLSVLGKYLKQDRQSASQFIPADLGSHDTFSILVRRYDKVGITEPELAEISVGLGRPISYKQVPNGWQLDVNIGGMDETTEQKAENRDVQRIHAVIGKLALNKAVKYDVLPRAYDSDYIDSSDYSKHIRRLENEIRKNTDSGRSGEGVGDSSQRRASDYAAIVELIKDIASKQESAFRKWTKDARELAAKRNIQFGEQEKSESGQRYSPGRSGREATIAIRRSLESDGRVWSRSSDRRKVGGYDLVARYRADAPEWAEAGVSAPVFVELKKSEKSARQFSEAITAARESQGKMGASVYVYPDQDYRDMRLFLTEDGKAGFALKDTGEAGIADIVSVFNTAGSSHRGVSYSMIRLAVEEGGNTLDAFDTFLPGVYSANGFKVVSRIKWNDEFALENWDKASYAEFNNGEPDIVFMAYDPQQTDLYTNDSGDGEVFGDYYEAVASQRAAAIKSKGKRNGKKKQGGRRGASPGQKEEGGRPESTGDGRGRYSGRGLAPLEGVPSKQGFYGPDPRLVEVAERYAEENGIKLKRQAEYVEVDVERAKRIADAYAEMKHDPQDPAVKEAYGDLIKQTIAQYKALANAGYEFYFIDLNSPEGQEYASTPWNALRDIRANKRMGVFSTEEGFGSSEDFNPEANPLLADTGFKWSLGEKGPKKRVLANDLFRAVHDAFGHGLEGASFRARGEENAWQAHVRLFYGPAVGAITSETRGQNSWLNYGPYGEKNRTAKVEDTVFADQKTGLMPKWTWTEGRAADMEEAGDEGVRYSPARQGRRKRDPDVTKAAQDLKAGLIDRDQYQRIVDMRMPLRKFDEVPIPASREDMLRGLGDRKAGERLKRDLIQNPEDIAKGMLLESRLDIPAYDEENVWVVSLHEPRPDLNKGSAGRVVAYSPTSVLKNVTFGVTETAAMNIAAGKPKSTIATMRGEYVPMTAQQAYKLAEANKDRWVEIGMNPIRHTYFYDKDTQTPVVSAEEVVQVGGMVLAKNPVMGLRDDYRYSPGRNNDAEYLAAVDKGDMKTAQRMVDEAAREAGYTSPRLYKAMPSVDLEGRPITTIQRPSEFPAFNRGEAGIRIAGFFAEDRNVAERFTAMTKPPAPIYETYLREDNPYVIDAAGRTAGDVQFGPSGIEFRNAVRSGKYDSIIIRNTADEGTVHVALDPSKIKSADPVTRDDAGNVIPISKRFDSRQGDVRYSSGRRKKDDILAGLYKHLEKEGVINSQVAGERTTSIKNRKTDELRAESGLPPRVRPTRESLEMWEEEARRRYPTAMDRLQLVAEIEKDPERLGKIESAAIGQHIAYLDNQRRAGKDVFDELRRTIKAANIGGTEAGRALVSRKAERFSDYSLAGLVNEHFSVVGSDPTDAQMQEYSELANRIEKLEKDKVDLAKKLAKETIARKKAEAELPPKQNPPQEKTGTKRATLLKKVADGFAAFQNAWGGKGSDRAAVGRQTETSAFKKWFGDSKVVDENGDPLVVYHGSPNANINNFKTWGWGASNAAFFSSDPDEAKHSRGKQSAVYPVYLSLKNPLILNAQDKKSVLGEVDQENELIGQSAADGYDGIIWKDALNDITTYAVFEPTQIKSATGNRGTFDSNNPDIRYSPGRQEPDIKSAAASLVATLREAGVSSMLELESQVNANMPNITPEQMQVIKDAWEESNKKDKVTSPIGANPQRADIAARAKELMRSAIELGYGAEKENWMDVVDVVHDQLSLEVPGIDKYDTMQAISDYGVWRELPPEQVEVIIRAVRGKARQSLKIEDALKAISQSNAWLKSGVSPEEVATRLRDQGLLPKATGQERATPDSIERDLIAEFNKLKKTLPVPAESREGQLKSALTTAKTAASNRLEMLDKDIASLQEAVDNRKELAKPVAEKSRLEPDAELASLRSQLEEKRRQRDELKAQYEKIFPDTSPKKGRKQLTDEQKIEASVKLLRRQIDAVKADVQSLIDGTWVAAGKSAELTSERKEELKAELALLRASQKQARQASPAYQAREEAKYWERYRKSQEKRLAFWMKRRDEAQAGRLPVPLQKRTITEKSIIQKNMEIEEAQYEAMIAIEKANRATWNAGQWIGQGILEATSLIPKTLMLGMEMSFVLRQGFFYTYSQPMKAFNALVESMPAVFSQRLALASMENIESRANAQEYHLAGVDFTSATGPKAKLEEMYQSSIMQWLERTETKLLLPLRTWAKVYAMFERGNRTFSNIMKADMYDIQKRDTLAAREFFGTNTDWTDNDIKQVGRTVNIFSGRGTGLKGGNPWLDWLFLARRWTWSRIQADFIVPFQLATPQWIGQWNADRGMRVALAKLYIQAMVGHAAKMAAAYFAYSVLAGDDEEEKPTMEFDLRSSDALALKIGETRFKDEGGLMPAVVLAARLLTGEIKTGKGEIKSIYGADVDYGGKTAADFVINYGRYKLGTAPSAILEWISGRDAVGNVMTKTDIVKSRLTPLTWREIYAAESELGLKRGTLAALEAFFGVSVSTHGDETKYKKANETDRLKQFETDLKRMEWDSPDPPYKDLLTADQMEKVKSQRDHKKQSVVYEAFVNPVRKNYKSDDSYKEAVEKRDKFLVEFKKSGLSFEESRKLLIDYWKRNYGSPYETKNGVSTLKEGITNRLRQLRKTLSGN